MPDNWLNREKGPPFQFLEWDEKWTDADYKARFQETHGYEAQEVRRYPGVGVLVGPLKETP